MDTGDVLRLQTPGGGGWGSPLERPPEQVAEDVRRGYYGRAAASEQYGVVLADDSFAVDAVQTAALRLELGGKA